MPIEQAESDGGVTQTVEAARLAVRSHLQACGRQHPVEVKAQHPVRVIAILQMRQKQIVVRLAKSEGLLRLAHQAVQTYRLLQGDDRFVVALGLWQRQAQVVIA